jgi:3-hydroxyacyl-CoA dehydrogenase
MQFLKAMLAEMNANMKTSQETIKEMMNEMKEEIKEVMNTNRKHSLVYCCMLGRVYIAIAWQLSKGCKIQMVEFVFCNEISFNTSYFGKINNKNIT